MEIHDLGGQPEQKDIRSLAYDGADVFLVAFSLRELSTLNNIPSFWMQEIKDANQEHVPKILIGTMSDVGVI